MFHKRFIEADMNMFKPQLEARKKFVIPCKMVLLFFKFSMEARVRKPLT